MQYTENFNLRKPQYADPADVADINYNSDRIDDILLLNRLISAESYDATETYNTGDLAVYENVLYKCLEDNVTGAWDSTKWTATNLASEIDGGGASALEDLTDVDIDSPAEGEVLKWDGEKWVNAEGSATVTKTADGNPIEITDGASAPLVKCVTEIQGSQDLHGQDKPWVGGAGKNKCPLVLADIKSANTAGTWSGNKYTINSVVIEVIVDSDNNVTGIKVDGTTTASVTFTIYSGSLSLSENTYTALGANVQINGTTTKNSQGTASTFTMSSGDYISFIWLYFSANTEIHSTFYPQIETGSTATTFEPYSNICPITAYTEGEIVSAGKNLFDNTRLVNTYFSASTGEISAQGGWTMSGKVYVEGNKTYYYYVSDVPGNSIIGCWDASDNYLGYVYYATGSTTFTTLPNTRYIRFEYVGTVANISVNVDSTDTSFNAYATTHTTTYPSAIYRGSEDVVNGEVTGEWGYSKGGTRGSIDSSGKLYKIADLNDSEFTQSGDVANMISSHLPVLSLEGARAANYPSICKYGVTAYVGGFVGNENALDALLPDLEVAYKLATPTTSSVTPTNLPIKSLSGYNHIESSTGDMEIEYITQDYQPLVDLIEDSKAESGHTYSTEEQVVGTWIDGSVVYETTVVIDSGFATSMTINHGISNISKIVGVEGIAECGSYFEPINDNVPVAGYGIRVGDYTATNFAVTIESSRLSQVTAMHITIRYTKSTAQTRSLSSGSLSLSKGEISGEKKKAEEEPIEEEKTAENDLDEWLEDSEEVEEEVDEGTDEDSDVEEEEENED